ncbi:DUF7470 family protein [Halorarius halobius]|uniref:DUF7470 family protein n=1 Tax=Halorarius halobius TaxID=2962671 RepID=UPI0020CE3D43|nr:hypothetical protein [Halorarius halobius]
MRDRLGLTGIAGVVLLVVGLAVVAYKSPLVAGGLGLTILGLLALLKGVIDSAMAAMGMGGMF